MKQFIDEPEGFYIYVHKRATDGKVFYVGKGKNKRYCRFDNRSKLWLNIVNKHGLIIDIVKDKLQEWYAFELEYELIALHGRRDVDKGFLVNHTDGGEGMSGHVVTEDQKAKMRGRTKELSALYDNNLYTLNNYRTGETVEMTKTDMYNTFGITYAGLLRKSRGVASTYKGWYIPGEITRAEIDARLNEFKAEYCVNTDNTVYKLINIDSLEEFTGTRLNFLRVKGFKLDPLLHGSCLVRKRWTTVNIFKENGLSKLRNIGKGITNGRTDKTVYTFVNLISDELFVGTRIDFENEMQIKIGPLFHVKKNKTEPSLTQKHWCLLDNKELVLERQSGFYSKHTFMNTKTGDIFTGSRIEFQIKYKLNIKNLFVNNRTSHLNWIIVK